jgi:hypothetical protein
LTGVNNLKALKFMHNVCIDMSFDTPEEIETALQKVSELCYDRESSKSQDENKKKSEL